MGAHFSALRRPEDAGNIGTQFKPQMNFTHPPDNRDAPFIPPFRPKVTPYAPGVPHPMESEIAAAVLHAQAMPVTEPEIFKELGDTRNAVWVDTVECLQSVALLLKDESAIAVDLEHHYMRSFMGLTCLMQISTRQHDWIVDTLKLRSEIHHALAGIFEDRNIVKVIHNGTGDVRWLERDFGIYVVNLFDTFIAAEELNEPCSLRSLLESYCDVQYTKEEKRRWQNFNWRVRPLPKEASDYARIDTHFLLYIHDRLRVGLHETDLLKNVIEASADVSRIRYTKPVNHIKVHERKGFATGLDNRQLHLLGALSNWRFEVARDEDESPSYILSTAAMIQLARHNPKDKEAVRVALRIAEGEKLAEFLENNAKRVIAVLKKASAEDIDDKWVKSINLRRDNRFKTEVLEFLAS